jgi:hypothetical protein
MKYEIHITVRVENIQQFEIDCKSIGLKPILIDTQTQNDVYQLMTSDKYEGDNYQDQLLKSVDNLVNLGYSVIRKKVEIMPDFTNHQIHPEHLYYESHIRFRFPKNYNKSTFINYCGEIGWHPSKNLFKSDDIWDYQMATLRKSDIDLGLFTFLVSQFVNNPMFDGIEIKKEIEECIYDTNVNVDDKWLNLIYK